MNQVLRSLQNGTLREYMEWQRQMGLIAMNLSQSNLTEGLIVQTNPYQLRYGIPATVAMM